MVAVQYPTPASITSRRVSLFGLTGFSATLIAFAFSAALAEVYGERALSGVFAAAITPVALAVVTNFVGQRITWTPFLVRIDGGHLIAVFVRHLKLSRAAV